MFPVREVREDGDVTITTTTGTASYPIPPSFPTPDLLRRDHEQSKRKLSSPILSMPPPSHPRPGGPATPPSSSVSRPSSPDPLLKVGSSPFVPPTQAGFVPFQTQMQTDDSPVSSGGMRVAVAIGQAMSQTDSAPNPPQLQVGSIPSRPQATSASVNAQLDSTASDLKAGMDTTRHRNDSISSQPPTIRFGFGDSDESARKSSLGGVGFSWGSKSSS